MKINEVLNEGFWSSVGKGLGKGLAGAANLTHGAVIGATGALKNAPDRLGAGTRLAADPKKLKAIPTTFTPKPKIDGTEELTSPDGKEKVTWDKNKRTLTISGPDGEVVYQKLKNGQWKDIQTDEIIQAKNAGELDTIFGIASGRDAPPAEKMPSVFKSNRPQPTGKPITVKLPTSGVVVTKSPQDGIWRLPDGEEITKPEYIQKLEARAKSMGQYYR